MMRWLILLVVAAGICFPLLLRGADEKKVTLVDYFLLLPLDYFEGPPANWLRFLKRPKCGIVDLANGYMSFIGDGAQPEFEAALFRYRNETSLLALSQETWKDKTLCSWILLRWMQPEK